MMRYWVILIGLCFSLHTLAIDVTTTRTEVSHEQNDQQLGIFTLEFSANEFPNVSASNPAYISFSLSQAPRFSRSMVDLRSGADEFVNVPINIAVYGTYVNTALPQNAVQLVRLIEGEKTGWLRINVPTSQWVDRGGAIGPPTSDSRVSITLGLSGRNSQQPNANTSTGGNQTDGLFISPASTFMIADYRNTPAFDIDDLETVRFSALGADTTGVETGDVVFPGSNVSAGFSNDGIVGIGVANVPCIDLHFQADEVTDAQPHEISVGRLDLINHNTYEFQVPTIYLSNTSDFDWLRGTRLYIHLPEYDVSWHYPALFGPTAYNSLEDYTISESTVITTGGNNSSLEWSVVPMYWGERIAGYELTLTSGNMEPLDRLDIDGLTLQMETDFKGTDLLLAGSTWWTNRQVFPEEDEYYLGPTTERMVTLSVSQEELDRQIIPYTAYNRNDLNFVTHVANPNDVPIDFAAFLYNRHGVLLRMYSGDMLPAYGKDHFNIGNVFGSEADGVLAWVELLSNGPLVGMGEVRSKDNEMLDLFTAQQPDSHELFAPHLPSATEVWQTHAYVVSTDTEVDTEINLALPNIDETRVNNVFLPGGTSILDDDDFFDGMGRAPWFSVNLPFSPAAGVLFYERIDGNKQLVSVPLSAETRKVWEFPHVANVDGGWWNGLVVFNPQDVQTEVLVTAYDSFGNWVTDYVVRVPAKSKFVSLLEAFFPSDRLSQISRLEVSGTNEIMSFLLVGFEASPLLTRVAASPASSNEYLFPYVGSGEEWTGIALVNTYVTEQEITVTPYREDGTPGSPVTYTLGSDDKVVQLMNDAFGNLEDFATFKVEATFPFQAMGLVGTFDGRYLATIEPHPIP